MTTSQQQQDETQKEEMDTVLENSRKLPVVNDVVQHVGGWFGFKPNQSTEDMKVADFTDQYKGDTTISVYLLCFFRNAS